MRVKEIIEESISVKKKLDVVGIEEVVRLIVDAYKNGKKVLVCGNGGSAADAQHMAGELVGRFQMERKGLNCVALTTDTSVITAWSNDYGFETVFERQVEALGCEGDILVAISTSGNSENVLKGISKANEIGMKVIGLSGNDGGKMKEVCNINLVVPSDNTARIQESHITIIHIICELVEKELFNSE